MSFFKNKYLTIQIGDVELDISKSTDGATPPNETAALLAIQASNEEGFTLDNDFLQSISTDIPDLLDGLSITVFDFVLAKVFSQAPNPNKYIISATFGATIDLSELPFFDKFLPPGAEFNIQGCQLTYCSTGITTTDIASVNAILPNGISPLPKILNVGINVSATLIMDGVTFMLSMKNASIPSQNPTSPNTQTSGAQPAPSTPTSNKGITNVNKQIGPINIAAFGLQLNNGQISLSITGGLNIGPLSLDFMGFEVLVPINGDDDPTVNLKGLSVSVNKPPLSIEGLFMQSPVSIPWNGTTTTIQGYNGGLTIGYNAYSLSAFGSYATLPDNTPTFFLYGFLGAPLGGPPVCFITGVAAGFGFNRTLTLPDPNSLSTHPLLAPVLNTGSASDFDALNLDFLPTEGAYWGAIGIRAESFKMISSFMLLVIQFYKELEIDIIGTSNMIFPLPKDGDTTPPLANIGIGMVARIIPEQGVVSITGAFLPGSYVFDPMANISGGFALLTIFKDQTIGYWSGAQEGDFVVTLGGYASNYTPESWYPQVSRLALNWVVSSDLSVKSEAYFAITPQALMAGGYLKANFNSGGDLSIRVYFKVGADFIIYWKPYHYSGDMYADLAVTAALSIDFFFFTLHVSVDFDLSADLTIWGPSFSGNASIRVHVLISFTVSVSFGENQHTPAPLGWDEFYVSFLPQAKITNSVYTDNIIVLAISNGLIPGVSADKLNVVNPKELVFSCNTAIPIKSVDLNGQSAKNKDGSNLINVSEFGIKPMANTASDFSESTFSITISKSNGNIDYSYINNHFTITPIYKNMPAALWKPASQTGQIPDDSGSKLITGLLAGVEIAACETNLVHGFEVPVNKVDLIATAPAQAVGTFSYDNTFKVN